jgi:2-keto-4-pentenoate hydratase/2-oxohepta-3-ene-1,7-dioic acid hydratase in catechol pathway
MKICRYDDNRIGVVRGGDVHDVSAIVEALPVARYPYPASGDALIADLDGLRPRMAALADAATPVPLSGVTLLSPVANPTKIIGTPANYKAHAAEAQADKTISQGRPSRPIEDQGLFLKANSALVGPGQGVALRFPDRRTDHEAELGVVIGTRASNISHDDALSCVAGYAIALDMVVRGPEDRSFRKSVDTYAVLGPWLVTADEIPDPEALSFSLSIDGETRQSSNTSRMIMDLRRQISWASQFYTLNPGDILMSGTCEGVSQVKPGDTMRVEFEAIGVMEVAIRAEY